MVVAHLSTDPQSALNPTGSFLRKSSSDELFQLWSISAGDMRFVGPLSARFNQNDLLVPRSAAGVDQIKLGLTGRAQVNRMDELPLTSKAVRDPEYLLRLSLIFDIKILVLTFIKGFKRDVSRINS